MFYYNFVCTLVHVFKQGTRSIYERNDVPIQTNKRKHFIGVKY